MVRGARREERGSGQCAAKRRGQQRRSLYIQNILNSTHAAHFTLLLQARVHIPDDRFRWLCSTYKPKSEVPAFLEIVDIAGLVKGAAAGEGLGNAFLSHIQVRALLGP